MFHMMGFALFDVVYEPDDRCLFMRCILSMMALSIFHGVLSGVSEHGFSGIGPGLVFGMVWFSWTFAVFTWSLLDKSSIISFVRGRNNLVPLEV